MTFPHGLTVTLIRRGQPTGLDGLGKNTYTPTNTRVSGCGYAPSSGSSGTVSSRETTVSQNSVTTQAELYMPAGTHVAGIDQVDVPGYGLFEVDGIPEVWPAHPMTGWQPPHSVIVRISQVKQLGA